MDTNKENSPACEKVMPYNAEEKKNQQVKRMFDAIAGKYDGFNRTMSFGIDIIWRKKAIKSLIQDKPQLILDVATGTGDFAIHSYKILHPEKIIGADISVGMMQVAAQKVEKLGLKGKIEFTEQDSENLQFEDNSFDAVTVSFGVRNFEHLAKGLSEMNRVIKPNGHLVILELSEPDRFPIKQLYNFYTYSIIPILGRLFSKDREAYLYLPKSITAFPKGEKMIELLKSCGFKTVEHRSFTMGVCHFYKATK